MLRVWIVCDLRLYADVFAQVFADLGQIEAVTEPAPGTDVAVFLSSHTAPPCADQLPAEAREAKLVVCWSKGDRGLVRLPGQSAWEEKRPFGFDQLVHEVLAGRQRALDP